MLQWLLLDSGPQRNQIVIYLVYKRCTYTYRAQSFTSLNADFQKEIKVKGGVLMEHHGFFGMLTLKGRFVFHPILWNVVPLRSLYIQLIWLVRHFLTYVYYYMTSMHLTFSTLLHLFWAMLQMSSCVFAASNSDNV